jgi:hypothetical protein
MKIRADAIPEPRRASCVDLLRRANVCSGELTEAQALAAQGAFGPRLRELLIRACEVLDEIDEVLVALHPVGDSAAFGRVAALHRRLEAIQSIVPTAERSLYRRGQARAPVAETRDPRC